MLDKYRDSTHPALLHSNPFIDAWMNTYCSYHSMHKPWVSDCVGCHMMAVDRIKAFVMLLDKLGVRVL